MKLTLRNYQSDILTATRRSFGTGHRKPLIVLPPGAGKTVCFAYMAQASQAKDKTVWFLIHRQELKDQTIETFDKFNIDRNLIHIGMVKTVANHPEKLPKPDFIIFDECFPGNTIINGKQLQSIECGDIIASYNHSTGKVENKKVLHIFKHTPKEMVKIKFKNGGELVCTPNHPVYTKLGYVPAHKLIKNDKLHLLQERGSEKTNLRPIKNSQKNWKSLLFGGLQKKISLKAILGNNGKDKQQVQKRVFRTYESKQSNVKPRNQRESFKEVKGNRALSKDKMWKRRRVDRTTTKLIDCIKRIRTLCRIRCSYQSNQGKRWITNLLQDRYCDSIQDDCNRSRWKQSYHTRKKSSRFKENKLFRKLRVESIKISKQTSDGTFGGLCPGGYVYNLEVEDNNNYFANGFLVHNCHHSSANTWRKIIDQFPDAYLAGLTATPCRLDQKPLGDVYDDLIIGVSAQELIRDGYLAPYKYFAPAVTDLSALKRRGRDYDAKQAAELLSERAVFGDVIRHYRDHADGLQAICYCSTVAHSEKTAQAFQDVGINAVSFDGTTPAKQRREIIQKYRNGEIQILCNCDLISEGFDVPDCHCCILLRPTMSTALFIQQSMRALRPQPDKTAIILDHVNNYQRHGLPDDHREWSLNDKIKPIKPYDEEGKLKIRQCPNCFFTYKSAPICPNCGYKIVMTREEIKNIKEIRLAEIKRKRIETAQAKVTDKTELSDCHTLAEIQAYAKKNGYKSGWAWYYWNGRKNRT